MQLSRFEGQRNCRARQKALEGRESVGKEPRKKLDPALSISRAIAKAGGVLHERKGHGVTTGACFYFQTDFLGG